MKWYSFIILVLLSCSATQLNQTSTAKQEIVQRELTYELLAQSSVGGYAAPQIHVIKEKSALDSVYNYINSIRTPGFVLPEIDFSKETLVAIFMGEKSTGGYAVSIKKIVENADVVEVYVKEKKPSFKEKVNMAITQPFCIVKVNTVKKLVFKK